jgi:PAS domain S-box-containing protein
MNANLSMSPLGPTLPLLSAIAEHDHAVQFYDDDAALEVMVAAYAAEAAAREQGILIIATESHRTGIAAKLMDMGVDSAEAEGRGQLIWLDAAETLSRFMDGADPDPRRFSETVSVPLAALTQAYGHVCAFGEMVALLWDDHNPEGALRLEDLWNDLARTEAFTLLCAYPARSVAGPQHDAAFQRVCRCHSRVIPFGHTGLRTEGDRLDEILRLQRKAARLEEEMAHRNAAEVELRKRERELRDFFEHAAEAIHTVAEDGTILSANAAELALLGYPAEEYVGQSIATFYADADLITDVLARLKRGETLVDCDARLICRDGTIKHVQINSNVYWEDGKFKYTRCFTRDVTARKQAEAALREADRRKDEFLATLAHELRNPLAPVSNGLHILESAATGDHIKRQALQMMRRQVHQLQHLIDDLMDISRISRGKIELKTSLVTVDAAIARAVDSVKPLVSAKRQDLIVVQPDEPIVLEGDLVRLAQAVSNILVNATKFTQPGGRIHVRVAREGPQVAIAVEDNGIGIPSDMISNIFGMFVQVDDAIGRSHGGLGIGLTLAKEIVALHGGSIQAESDGPERGSTFVIRLPVHASMETGAKTELAPDAPSLKIIVVDDNLSSARTLGWMLEGWGHAVRVAGSSEEIPSLVAAFSPDVVLLDIGMPGLNGYDLCRQLRDMAQTRDCMIIAQTGWGQETHKEKSLEAGFDHHLVKPVDVHVLRKLLAERAANGFLSASDMPACPNR